ncbi:hypothetical protein K7X08_011759 [Anisodus acutangulus]|uniref:Uncharacterized protein n=1 Tax=Anisodus acutangulus TaxID=402998 RepID=A0A9Q1MKE8_9SOLA|nr:hypothetical protein K7X08_011759 [Anisodus acutangulus]
MIEFPLSSTYAGVPANGETISERRTNEDPILKEKEESEKSYVPSYHFGTHDNTFPDFIANDLGPVNVIEDNSHQNFVPLPSDTVEPHNTADHTPLSSPMTQVT